MVDSNIITYQNIRRCTRRNRVILNLERASISNFFQVDSFHDPINWRMLSFGNSCTCWYIQDTKFYIDWFQPLLENFLCDMKPLAEISDTLLSAMTNIFKDVRSAFNAGATPHRHVFNPHCLSEIYQGLTLADPATLKQPADALTIITHECMRVYGDRLVTTMEKNQLQDLIQKVFGNHFPNLKSAPEECATFTDLPFDRKERVYQEVKDPDKLRLFLEESLSAWNDLTEEPMDLIFFPEAIRRVTQMNRIFRLRKPCILVGPQGSGRRSIVRLVSYLNDCGCVEVEGNDSSLEEVLETLRSCYRFGCFYFLQYLLNLTCRSENASTRSTTPNRQW